MNTLIVEQVRPEPNGPEPCGVSEKVSFLLVGAAGYVVDVGLFNLLRSFEPFRSWDPAAAKVLAVAVAVLVTYLGNALVTWRGSRPSGRQVLLFLGFNLIGLGLSVATLWLSHTVLGLTTRLEDNISANVVGVALGTLFRFWTYRRFVFAE